MFFNRDFVGGWLDVISMKRFQFVETDKELSFFFVSFFLSFIPPKWSCWNPLMSPWPPFSLSQASVVFILSCTVFLEVTMLMWRTCNLLFSCKHPPWIVPGRAEASDEYINVYLCVSVSFLCIDVFSLWWDVVSQREKVAGRRKKNRLGIVKRLVSNAFNIPLSYRCSSCSL